jgi:hypothetical protein
MSLIEEDKLIFLIKLLKTVDHLDGNISEVGVYKGGSAFEIANNTKSNIYLFDTFTGMPCYDSEKDGSWKIGSFEDTCYEQVKDMFKNFQNVFIYKGFFPRENSHMVEKKIFKFVHLDVDNYTSYKECLEYFYKRIVSGGIIIFDDYNNSCCPGANLAVDEFFKDKEEVILIDKAVYVIKK